MLNTSRGQGPSGRENISRLQVLRFCCSVYTGKKFRLQTPAAVPDLKVAFNKKLKQHVSIIQDNNIKQGKTDMAKNIARRDLLKMGMAATACAAAGILTGTKAAEAKEEKRILKAGIITDMHRTTKADSSTRTYSAAMNKMKVFIDAMKKEKPAFLIELGDFVDTLAPGTARSAVPSITCSATTPSTTSSVKPFLPASPTPA